MPVRYRLKCERYPSLVITGHRLKAEAFRTRAQHRLHLVCWCLLALHQASQHLGCIPQEPQESLVPLMDDQHCTSAPASTWGAFRIENCAHQVLIHHRCAIYLVVIDFLLNLLRVRSCRFGLVDWSLGLHFLSVYSDKGIKNHSSIHYLTHFELQWCCRGLHSPGESWC